MGGGIGRSRVGLRSVLVALLVLAAVSAFTWLFVTGQWSVYVLEIFDPKVNPVHIRIADGAAALLFVSVWWLHLRVKEAWKKLALVGLALGVWALSMPAIRAALFQGGN
jgi:hypothetical protein